MPATAQDAPLVRITLPVRGQTVRGSVTVQGSATSPAFSQYQVAYAAEPDIANWTIINAALQPVSSGALAVWNTRPLPDGKYALRLQVFNTDGSVSEIIVQEVTLANTATATPNVAPGAGVTDTTALTQTAGISATIGGTPGSETGAGINLSDIPRAFVKGATYALYVFVALGVYVLLKKALSMLLRRMFHKPVDYGR
jgi:hypothetical protein